MSSQRKIFQDVVLNQLFADRGYVIVPLLSAEQVLQLRDFFFTIHSSSLDGFYSSLYSSNEEAKAATDQKVKSVLDAPVLNQLLGYRILVTNFVTKAPGEKHTMPGHQDWSFVDENEFISMNVWVPLEDTTFQNGGLCIMEGTHHFPFSYRGTNVVSLASTLASDVLPSQMTSCDCKAGHAVIYNHKMVHASPPNSTDHIRLAVSAVVIPQESDPLHYSLQGGKLLCHQISSEMFHRYTYGREESLSVLNEFPTRVLAGVNHLDVNRTYFEDYFSRLKSAVS